MDIITNLGYSFSSFKDLLRFMEEENIETVIYSLNYWGANIPNYKATIQDIRDMVGGKYE